MSWESQGIALLTASLVRPFVLVTAAWVILRVFRVRHPASRHTVWTAVLIGMLLLPFVSVTTPHWKLPVLPRKHEIAVQPVAPEPAAITASAPLNSVTYEAQAKRAHVFSRPSFETLTVWCYFAGLFAMVTYRVAGWALLWRVMSRSRLLRGRMLRESGDVLTPVAVGVLRPVVILPAEWHDWNANTKRAVLAHEFAHLRRHDALVSALGWWVRCVFWFHPLAWWVSRKVSGLAELACDAAALEKVGDPAGYSRMLLGFADAVNRSGRRVTLPGLAMAEGTGIERRIDLVFELSDGNMRKLARPGVLLVLLGLPVVCLAATVGLGENGSRSPLPSTAPVAVTMNAPAILAQSPPQTDDRPLGKPSNPEPRELVTPQIVAQNAVPRSPAQLAPVVIPKFDVASIRLCKDSDQGPGRGSGRGAQAQSRGRLHVNCATVRSLIEEAFGSDGPPRGMPINGGPGWIESDRYAIEAEAEGDTDEQTMRGPMMQALLEDRFQLKIHRETKDIPVYALTVARGGPKLQPFQEGECVQHVPGATRPAPGETPWCGLPGMRTVRNGSNVTWDVRGASFLNFSTFFGIVLDRPVIDKTGIAGIFDFHLEFAPDETTSGPGSPFARDRGPQAVSTDPSGSPSIFTAFQEQLGLKLESAKGPGESLVIDHIERPSEN